MELKSLYFNSVYVVLFSAKTRINKQNTHTYTQSGAENSLFQFCLIITEPRFLLSRGHEKLLKVAFLLAKLFFGFGQSRYGSIQKLPAAPIFSILTHRCLRLSAKLSIFSWKKGENCSLTSGVSCWDSGVNLKLSGI